MFEEEIKKLTNELKELGLMLATAESCTGGMVAMAFTNLAGSSSVFERGFVTYSNDSKRELLNVSHEILESHGAVSRECAAAMVRGTLANSHADVALSITGVAGPGGGSADKPVGLVYIGWGRKGGEPGVAEHHFKGDRASVREQSAHAALCHLGRLLSEGAS